MSSLNISKVAVGCASFDTLKRRQEKRLVGGPSSPLGTSFVPIVTRFKPKRADELIGGSIYWIIKHRITARQAILGFDEAEDRRTVIRLDPKLVPVRALPKRAHQGWRYLDPADAPQDFDGHGALAELPPALVLKLSALALI